MRPEQFILSSDYTSPANDDADTITVTIPGGRPIKSYPDFDTYSATKVIGSVGAHYTYSTKYSRASREVVSATPHFTEVDNFSVFPNNIYTIYVSVSRVDDLFGVSCLVSGSSSIGTIAATITVRIRTFKPV